MAAEIDFLRRVRRELHAHPELGHAEYRTAGVVERELRAVGLTPRRVGATGVVALVGAGTGPAIVVRADLDAVPVSEHTGASYASTVSGIMHACGHDGHVAALLLLARRLAAARVAQPVILVFQPAEEVYPSGAPIMVREFVERHTVRAVYAMHLWPELAAGVVGAHPGPLMASVAGVRIDVSGSRGVVHGERAASGGVDALSAAIKLYEVLHCGDSGRSLGPGRPSALHLGLLRGGSAPQTVPERATLEGTLRAVSVAAQREAQAAIERAAAAVARATGANVETRVTGDIRPPLINDAECVEAITRACAAVGVPCQNYPSNILGISEDIGCYAEPAADRLAMFLLGTGAGPRGPLLHDSAFDFDESTLVSAVDVFERLVQDVPI